MNLLHVVGRKNHGKTTLILDLVAELTRQGRRVGTIKHSSHSHELDTPGKDSHRQRLAGADPAAIVACDLIGLYVRRPEGGEYCARLAPLFADCELVLVEGDIEGPGPKVEVWRAAMGTPPLAAERAGIAALISDDEAQLDLPRWPRCDVARLAAQALALAAGS